MPRPTKGEVSMEVASLMASRSTCARRSVGCVLTDEQGRLLAAAYNGVASGMPHCNEGHECAGIGLARGLDSCEAVHAEQNALIQCRDIDKIAVCFVTLSPCRSCVKLLLNTPCKVVIFKDEFEDPFPRSLWVSAGREWRAMAKSA